MSAQTTRPHEFRLDDHETPPLSQVRAWIRTVLADLDPDLVADTELIATELAANAYEHAQAPRAIRLAHQDEQGVIRLEVDDANPELLPRPGTSTLGEFRGRGLVLIKSMGAAWGVERHPDRKTVWAEIPEPPV
ncbi:ATP-binding protein [Umezawaea sp. NPDC059074]|uniref:ATP-binding protein n=1 Tax=Umezawaea sp. NPDC059074 TaxID=3346716 RepID=UPI0036864204